MGPTQDSPSGPTSSDPDGPKVTAWAIKDFPKMRLVPAFSDRAWIKATEQRFASRCLPLLVANQSGWFLLSSHKIRVTWTGWNDIESLQVEMLSGEPPCPAASHFGHGILTWTVPYLFRTPPGYNLLVRGPANWPKDGIYPLEGIVETDWSEAAFTMNWKMTRPVQRVTFEEGEPIALLVPQRRGELESFQPEIRAIEDAPELREGYLRWFQSRRWFNAGLRQPGSEAQKQGWQKHYFQGVHLSGEPAPEHQTKLKLKGFVDLRSTTGSTGRPYVKRAFLSPAECAAVTEVIGRYARGESGLKPAVNNDLRIEIRARHVYDHGLKEAARLLSEIRDRCHQEIPAAFGVHGPLYPDYMMLQLNYPGDAHVRHADNKRYDPTAMAWVANHTPHRVFSVGVYLNRCGQDFTGGELVFPALGLAIPPEPGLLVAFPSDERFEHEVWPIASGQRYSVLVWFTNDPALAEPPLVPPEALA